MTSKTKKLNRKIAKRAKNLAIDFIESEKNKIISDLRLNLWDQQVKIKNLEKTIKDQGLTIRSLFLDVDAYRKFECRTQEIFKMYNISLDLLDINKPLPNKNIFVPCEDFREITLD